MGEEPKKPEENKAEPEKQQQQPDEAKKVKKEEEKPAEEGKDCKEGPPQPPPEIVLRVYMHCEGCARKVRRCLKGFPGVESVTTDCKSHKAIVKGEKVDPLKVQERVQRKSHRQVDLLSPIPKQPPPQDAKKKEESDEPKPEEKKEEAPPSTTVVLRVHMHCEACAEEIKKRILRMKGVESAEPDLKGSQVAVKGVFEPARLVEYVYKRTGKHAAIVAVKQEPEKKEEDKGGKDVKEEKKAEPGAAAPEETAKAPEGDAAADEKDGGGESMPPTGVAAEDWSGPTEMDMKKYEYYYHYQIQPQMPLYTATPAVPPSFPPAYPPQIFSDENPNACSVM